MNSVIGISRLAKRLLFGLVLLLAAILTIGAAGRAQVSGGSSASIWDGSWFSARVDALEESFSIGSFYHKDRTAPTISLYGKRNPTLEKGTNYDETELGFYAVDNFDGDLSASVVATETKNGVSYTVTDAAGNTATAFRKATFVDTLPPEITFTGGAEYNLTCHEEYVEPGFTAIDLGDGDISSQVTVTGTVDNRMIGDCTLTYTVTDSCGHTTSVDRIVHVVPAEELAPIEEGDKVIYLTFDDGPYAYTEQLLELLDKYDIKVTFFVTDQYDDYIDLISEEYARGHTVAVHTYSHDYDDIYSSVDAYFADFDKMNDIIEEKTGTRSNLFRFPGGSSNTVSSFTPGVVTAIAEEAANRGYYYFDWNVSSGDASGTDIEPSEVAANVISDIESCDYYGYDYFVSLQHDIKEYSVNAVEEIILWALDNGYIFRPLDETSPGAHHGISN